MGEPVTLALKGASTAFTICEATYKLILGIKKAPKDIARVATDLKGFYGILGALENSVQSQRLALDKPGPAAHQLQNITSLIGDCVAAFREIQEKIQDFIALNGKVISGLSEAFKWDQFQKEDVQYLRVHLSNMKLSLNLALSSLTLLVVSSTHDEVLAVRRDISHLQEQLILSDLQEAASKDLPDRTSIAPVSTCLSFASTGSIASSRYSMALFVVETDQLIDGLDNHESMNVPESDFDELSVTASELLEFVQKELTADIKRDYSLAHFENGIMHTHSGLDLSSRKIHVLPLEVVALINLSANRLPLSDSPRLVVPNGIVQCHCLRYLSIRGNELDDFPKAILQLAALHTLDISDNAITSIPESIKGMVSLLYLFMDHNKITRLPLALGDMALLEYITIEQNPIEFPPVEVLDLRSLDPIDDDTMRHTCTRVKQYLRDSARHETVSADSGMITSGGGSVEFPRPSNRNRIHGRFAVKPSVSGTLDLDLSVQWAEWWPKNSSHQYPYSARSHVPESVTDDRGPDVLEAF
ncbi:RAM signaling network component [Elasticomyces elasticus]|nr:RAM signaling network component [Elasticomyces elasticus]